MKYSDLIKILPLYQRIVVSGPQRSGTTITAKMIGMDLGYKTLIEESFNVYDAMKFFSLLTRRKKIVIQAPALSHLLGEITDPDTAVIFMMRDNKEIQESQDRIGWQYEGHECSRYFRASVHPAEIKKECWILYQRERIRPRAYELDYNSLAGHPLWIDKENRVNFTDRQTL